MNGISSVTDCPRPGQAHRVVTPEAIATVEAIVKENRHITVNEIATHLDVIHGSAHHIVHDFLQFHKYLRFSFDSPMYIPMQRTEVYLAETTGK
jgi:phosphoribosylaminoimidazole carboxylase (NCAIR synthetase)